MVVPVTLDDLMENSQGQGPVGAGPQPEPQLRVFRQFVGLGIHHDQGDLFLQGVPHVEGQLPVGAGDGRIGPPDQDAAGPHVPVIVHPGEVPGGEIPGILPGTQADQRPGGGGVGGIQHVSEAPELGQVVPSRAGDDGNALGAGFLPDLRQPGGDGIIGFVPGDVFPFAAALFADPTAGTQQPVGMVHLFDDAHALDAAPAPVQGSVGIRAGLYHPSVLHGEKIHAPSVAASTGRLEFRHGITSLLSLL